MVSCVWWSLSCQLLIWRKCRHLVVLVLIQYHPVSSLQLHWVIKTFLCKHNGWQLPAKITFSSNFQQCDHDPLACEFAGALCFIVTPSSCRLTCQAFCPLTPSCGLVCPVKTDSSVWKIITFTWAVNMSTAVITAQLFNRGILCGM